MTPSSPVNDLVQPRFRLGLLVDDAAAVSRETYDLVSWAQSHPRIALTHLIVAATPLETPSHRRAFSSLSAFIDPAQKEGPAPSVAELAFQLVDRLERTLLARDKHHFADVRTFDLRPVVNEIVTIAPIGLDAFRTCSFSQFDVERVQALGLDLILRCGRWNPRGEILDTSRLGILSIACGDPRAIRGGPPGFWEVYSRCDTTGFSIVRIRNDTEIGDVLMQGFGDSSLLPAELSLSSPEGFLLPSAGP